MQNTREGGHLYCLHALHLGQRRGAGRLARSLHGWCPIPSAMYLYVKQLGAAMNRHLFILSALSAVLVTGCDSQDTGNEHDYRVTVATPASFGFRALYGLHDSDDFDRVLTLVAGRVYTADNVRVPPSDEGWAMTFNGVDPSGDDFEFEYTPGREYTVTAGLYGESVAGTVRAPSISAIRFTSLPDTSKADQPITIEWDYPPGETNDGAIIVNAGWYSSGLLDPKTTAFTLPANALDRQWGTVLFQVWSVRYVVFTGLTNPLDPSVVFVRELDREGSMFAVIVGVSRYAEVERVW